MTVLAVVCVCLAMALWPIRRGSVIPAAAEVSDRPARALRLPGRRRRRNTDLDALTTMVEGIAPAVTAGVTPAGAVATAALLAAATVSSPALRDDLGELARRAAGGAELAPLWAALHQRHEVAALGEVARAWSLSEQLGCPIGEALAAATAMMREQLDLERRIAAATAGPRATMQLLTVLPVLGVGIAMLIGVPPWRLYAGALGVSVLVLGALFVAAGRLLTRRMIRRASASATIA